MTGTAVFCSVEREEPPLEIHIGPLDAQCFIAACARIGEKHHIIRELLAVAFSRCLTDQFNLLATPKRPAWRTVRQRLPILGRELGDPPLVASVPQTVV